MITAPPSFCPTDVVKLKQLGPITHHDVIFTFELALYTLILSCYFSKVCVCVWFFLCQELRSSMNLLLN